MADLVIDVDGRQLTANWTDDAPETREAIEAALPIEGNASRWGDELYVRTAVDVDGENTQTEVPVGALAYWPQGNALCLFWGPTPASAGDEPRAASPVSVVALVEDVGPLSDCSGGAMMSINADTGDTPESGH